MKSSKNHKNRKRCLACKYYDCNVCSLMCNADVFEIDNCILEDLRIKQIKEGTAEWFIFIYNPVLFLKYLNYQRKEKLPYIGSKVVTLRSGFGGLAGETRYIKEINEKYITLTNKDDKEFISSVEKWYETFFEI